jgi:hypothetical protein
MDTGNEMAQQLMDLKAAAGGTGVKPRPPLPPLPKVKPNPQGGSIVTVQKGNFPVTLSLLMGATNPVVKRNPKGGTIVGFGSSGFPIEFDLAGGPNQNVQNGTAITLPPHNFPIVLEIISAGGPMVEDNTGTPSLFGVNEAKFPVVVSLATPPPQTGT